MFNIKKMLSLLAIYCFSFLNSVVVHAMDTPPNPTIKAGYYLDFSDEFNQDSLDKTYWTDYYLPHWCDDPEASKGNYRFEDGCLIEYITEDQKSWCPKHDGDIISSAIMSFDKSWIHNFSNTRDNHDRDTWYGYVTKYGYFEIRAKLANCGGGGHQAWWMVGMQQDTDDWYHSKQTGEIDILENYFYETDIWHTVTHEWSDPDFHYFHHKWDYTSLGDSATDEFHIYAMEWSPSGLKFYYDNQLVSSTPYSPNYEMGTILNIYANPDQRAISDVWPKEWYIDYFRVWKPNNGYFMPERGTYLLKNRLTENYLCIDPESRTAECTRDAGNKYTQWNIHYVEDDYALLKNTANGEYLYVEGQELKTSASPEDMQKAHWTFSYSKGYIRLTNRGDSKYTIYISDGSNSPAYGKTSDFIRTNQWEFIPAHFSS